MFDNMDIDTFLTKMNGTFLTPPNPPWLRQLPGSEADKVRDQILIDRSILVTREEIIKLGKDPKVSSSRYGISSRCKQSSSTAFSS
jgi:hypothetical protein